MPLSRRAFLQLASLVAASAVLPACAPASPAAAPLSAADWHATDWRALQRLTFGPRPAECARVAEIGLSAWIEEQLAPDSIDDWDCHFRLRNLDTLNLSAQDLFDYADKLFDDVDLDTIPTQLRQGTLLRQVYSQRQLAEVLVEFWNDHFHIATAKGDCFYLKTVDDRTVARAHALGNFRDLLWASAHSPAMLVYLDNQANVARAPNENYARELLELHTLGVNGGYTQQDVMALARCLTGWTVKEHFWRGDFTFDAEQHAPGNKQVLGQAIQEGGQAEAESVLDYLAQQPATAHFLATKLVRRFIADDPPAELVAKAAQAFLKNNGDLRATVRVVLLDGLPLAQPKYRRPVNFVVAALRQLNAESDCGPALQAYLTRLGQLPFGWPTPDGYPDTAAAWQGNLLPRWQLALALARNEIENTSIALEELAPPTAPLTDTLATLSQRLLGATFTATAQTELLTALQKTDAADDELRAVLVAGLIAAPAFQWR